MKKWLHIQNKGCQYYMPYVQKYDGTIEQLSKKYDKITVFELSE